jgi:predicted Zn-dependent peptidase
MSAKRMRIGGRFWTSVLVSALVLLVAVTSTARLPKNLKFGPIEYSAPEVEKIEFPNGLHGYFLEDHEIPVINIVIMFKATYPDEARTGLNGLAGWAMRNGGSANFSKEKIDDELEFVGSSIETSARALTGTISANFLTKDADMVVEILTDLIVNPAFEEDKIELHKKSMIESIRRKADDPWALGRREYAKIIYKNHPAGREATAETVSGLTRDDAIEFHDKYVRPDNAVIGITGDLTRDEAFEMLETLSAAWEAGGEDPVVPPMEFEMEPSINYIYKDVNQAYIFAGHMGLNSANEDRPLVGIMNYILGGGSFTSWITQRIRSDEGLAYSARSSYRDSPWGYGLFTGSCQTRSDAAMRALGLLVEQIERMKTEGPSAEEVNNARDAIVNQQVFEYESSARVVNRMVWFDITGQPLDTLERELAVYQAAGLEDVKRAGSEYLHPANLTILVVGNEDLFDRPLSDFGEVNVIEIKEIEEPEEG